MAFPTLSRNPRSIEVAREKNVIATPFEDGYQLKRKKFTKTRKIFIITYDMLPEDDRDLIEAHFDSVGLYTTFTWTDNESNEWTVIYEEPPKFARKIPGWFMYDVITVKER